MTQNLGTLQPNYNVHESWEAKNHHFSFGTNGKVVVLGVPILRHFRVSNSQITQYQFTYLKYLISLAVRQGFPVSRMTTNYLNSPMKIFYSTSFTLSEQSKRSRAV